MADIIQRQIPNAVKLERELIGCLLYDSKRISSLEEIVSPDDFYDTRFKIIFATMLDIYHRGLIVSIPLLQEELKNSNISEIITDDFFRDIMMDITGSVYAESYAHKIKEKSILRLLIDTCQNVEKKVFESKDNIDSILEYTEKFIFKVIQSKKISDFHSISDVLMRVIDQIEINSSNKNNLTGVTTGFRDLNNRTGGLQNSDLILVAARPAMGKTSFCLNLAKSAASSGVTTAIFSLEMSCEQLGSRLLSMDSGISASKLKTGYDLKEYEWNEIISSSERLIKSKLLIDDTASINISELRSKCRKAKLEHNLGLIVIDYLQLMSSRGKENRQQEISEISRGLKLIAKELNVPVVALSQLSRACETRADHRPMLSDLRESGAIEQDADVVMFLYRDEYYNEETENKGIAEVIIAKQRNGSTGTVKLRWLADQTRFVDLAE